MRISDAAPSPRRRPTRVGRGFTLVELLVVIGIIGLLIAILLPSLSKAQKVAQRVNCGSKLHEVMQAAVLHANNHRGYYPLAGVLPACQGQWIGDTDHLRYTYLSTSDLIVKGVIAPITIALAREMASKEALGLITNDQTGQFERDTRGFIKYFTCPAQSDLIGDVNHVPMLYTGANVYNGSGQYIGGPEGYSQFQSYVYNEYVVGMDPDPTSSGNEWVASARFHHLAGQAARVRQPAMTMFAADGLQGKGNLRGDAYFVPTAGMYTIYPTYTQSIVNGYTGQGITLADAYNGVLAGDPACFDKVRHQGKLNVAFCDGHVDSRYITAKDLATVYVVAP